MTLYEMLDITLYTQPVWIYAENDYRQNMPVYKGTVNGARQDTNNVWVVLMEDVIHYECDLGVS